MELIPESVYLARQVREMDRIAIEKFRIPGYTLMQRAGEAAFDLIREHWQDAGRIVLLVGPGNNGGDGYVIARMARSAGMQVQIFQAGDHTSLHGDARSAHDAYMECGGSCDVFSGELPGCDLIVDALLGSGLTRPVKGEFAAAIRCMNTHCAPVLSVDVPSGLDADRGVPLGDAVTARATITFVGMKLGLITGAGRRHSGKIYFSDLQVPDAVRQSVQAACQVIDPGKLRARMAERHADAHKGEYGHVLLIGGNSGMTGSVMLAAEAAARTGCGLVSVATVSRHAPMLSAACREVMVHGVESVANLDELVRRASVVAVGPGLGQDSWAKIMLARILELDLPTVVDADALNLLARDPLKKQNWILTPHPGEAARLTGSTSQEVQQQRLVRVQALQQKFGGVCVLKGSGTLVACEDRVSVCTAGNPGMASGGMGDVLTGIISGLLAQGLGLNDAACLGVQLHAQSADIAAREGMRGMLASDLFGPLRKLANDSDSEDRISGKR